LPARAGMCWLLSTIDGCCRHSLGSYDGHSTARDLLEHLVKEGSHNDVI
jgi:hypothetical protein